MYPHTAGVYAQMCGNRHRYATITNNETMIILRAIYLFTFIIHALRNSRKNKLYFTSKQKKLLEKHFCETVIAAGAQSAHRAKPKDLRMKSFCGSYIINSALFQVKGINYRQT